MRIDPEHCYRAACAKDPRFDGWFFTAVTSTGIYCRPSCPARTPKRENVRFYPSAAACQQAGFRACKRCRPDASPGSPEWNARGDVTGRAMRLIADGVVDREGVPALAGRLGYSVRQVERVLRAELGAGPLALARAQRAQTARTLIEASSLKMAEVALAAGFSSIRQFNDTVRSVFALSPSELRRRAKGDAARSAGMLRLRLAFRRPLSPENLFGHLAATAVPGVEEVRGGTYRRTLRLPHGTGIAELTPDVAHISCRLALEDLRDLGAAISRCRWLLDLDADPEAIDERLALDPALQPSVARWPGRRVPRTVDGDELAIRVVLGQQISTAAARTIAATIAARWGEPVADPDGGLSRLFPLPAALTELDVAMPAARRHTVQSLAAALAGGALELSPAAERGDAIARPAEDPRSGTVERRADRDARARRSRRVPGDRPRGTPWCGLARARRDAAGAHRALLPMEAVARVRRAAPLGCDAARRQRLAARPAPGGALRPGKPAPSGSGGLSGARRTQKERRIAAPGTPLHFQSIPDRGACFKPQRCPILARRNDEGSAAMGVEQGADDGYVVGFAEIDRGQIALVGGKGAQLGELSRIEGIVVPPGFCVTTRAFRRALAEAAGVAEMLEALSSLGAEDRDAIAREQRASPARRR